MTLRPPFLLHCRQLAAQCLLGIGLLLTGAAALADEYAEVQKLQQSGQAAAALARADKYIAANPRDPQMRFIKSGLLSAVGQRAEAEELLTNLTRDYPELPEPWNNLAVLYASQGQLDKAEAALQSALRITPLTPRPSKTWATCGCARQAKPIAAPGSWTRATRAWRPRSTACSAC